MLLRVSLSELKLELGSVATAYGDKHVDWRELIYQMALDYYKCGKDEDFYFKMMEKNPWTPLYPLRSMRKRMPHRRAYGSVRNRQS